MSLPLRSARAPRFSGIAQVPGDKSISHRSLLFAALAVGETVIDGLLEGEDVLRSAAAIRALGAEVHRDAGAEGDAPPRWRVWGRGVGGLGEPEDVLDMGNSGTSARLLLGMLAAHPFTALMTGDASLRRRPMARVTEPLAEMGARFLTREGGRLPLAVRGRVDLLPVHTRLKVASAQVKSALLLAGLHAPGETVVVEPAPSRDHTETMLRHMGATVRVEDQPDGTRAIAITGEADLTARPIAVPGDPSSAAFPAVAALLVPDAAVTIPGVSVNPLRFGLYETLLEMGADITLSNRTDQAGEPVADLTVRASALKGVRVPPERAPRMIDEYPILAVAAACAEGETRMEGLAELKVKESDRLASIAGGLSACGVRVAVEGDTLIVWGEGKAPPGGATVPTRLDHRIAMAFLVLGMVAEQTVAVDDAHPIDTSFPGFVALMNELGAAIAPVGSPFDGHGR